MSVNPLFVALTGTALLLFAGAARPKPPGAAGARELAGVEPGSGRTHAEMHNVLYHYDNSLFVHIRRLQGALLATRAGIPPTFDDKTSFTIAVDSAEIAVSSGALATLMNKHVFSDPASPIKNVKISMQGSQLKQTGTVHKGVDLPFEMRAEVSATSDGLIRMHPVSFNVIHVPVKGAMHTLGLHLSDLVNPKRAPGVRLIKDDLILDPSQMLPPPKLEGHITAVRIEGDQMVEVIGKPMETAHEAGNYMKFTGGVIRFGKLTMRDADLSLIDQEPKDPFQFSLDRYKDQLVAGYSKTTPTFGLDVFMPDVTRLRAR